MHNQTNLDAIPSCKRFPQEIQNEVSGGSQVTFCIFSG